MLLLFASPWFIFFVCFGSIYIEQRKRKMTTELFQNFDIKFDENVYYPPSLFIMLVSNYIDMLRCYVCLVVAYG